MTTFRSRTFHLFCAAIAVAALMLATPAHAGGANGGKKPVCAKKWFLLDDYFNTHCFWAKGTCLAPICPESVEEGYANNYGSCGVDFNGVTGLQGYLGSLLGEPQSPRP